MSLTQLWSPFRRLTQFKRFAVLGVLWLVVISALHYWLNFEHGSRRIITMGYMPVITNMAAPLLDKASLETDEGPRYRALKYASFAEMAESLRNGEIQVAFMIAPLSIVLRQQGEDVKVVLIGNRHESTLVARKGLGVENVRDLVGKTVAVPMRYSGHNLSMLQLIEERGLTGQINVVEMNPPDMASALASGSLDAYYVGEPFAAQTLKSGDSELVHYVEEVWDGFICNLVVMRQATIDEEPELVQTIVEGAVRSGLWASKYPKKAAAIASQYWNQPADLVEYAMTTPPKRIVYNRYEPIESEMKKIADLMVQFNLSDSTDIDGLVEPRFARQADTSDIGESLATILP